MQAIGGHMDIMSRRVPVADVLAGQPEGELKTRLNLALEARDFASRHLGLPDNGSYRSYVDLPRKYVTWNVIATEEFSVQAREWCFPVAGCVPYRGYFAQASAVEFGERLAGQGLDVHVSGASAYSTLGWFDDPLLSTMLRWRETRLVGVIFHELAHQVIWVENDTTFNESFAVFVQREGVRRWLSDRGADERIVDYEQRVQRQREFVAMLLASRRELSELYAENADAAFTRAGKQRVFEHLRERYADLKHSRWEGFAGYDYWFSEPLNNARLALTATYHDYVDSFAMLFAQANRDFPAFYHSVRTLAALPREERNAALRGLAARPGVLSAVGRASP